MLRCPYCQASLALTDRTFRCDAGHSYDLAKEGYVNLLLAQNKKTKEPGDSKAMLQSRRRFLDTGHYQPLAEALSKYWSVDSEQCLLDLGCGEAYYSHALSQHFPAHQWSVLDIAKPGVQMAGKRKFAKHAVVGSAYDLPFDDHSFDDVLCVFSPFSADELKRVLKPNGRFILVGPAPAHLNQLASLIYDQVKPHGGNISETEQLSDFTLVDTQQISYQTTIQGSLIYDLLTMTPYFWQSTQAQQQMIQGLETLTVDLDFFIQVYRL